MDSAQAHQSAQSTDTVPAEAPVQNGTPALTIVAFGSSSTEGVGATTPAANYPNRLQGELRAALAPLKVTVVNRGIGGEDVDDMMRRLPAIIAERPNMIIWQTGSNDPIRQVPLVRFVAETRAGVRAMRQAGIAVILMEPQDCEVLRATPGALRYRDAVRQIGAEFDIPVIRRWDLMQTWLRKGAVTQASLMWTDGLHMTDGGYALLAHAVADQVLAMRGATLKSETASVETTPHTVAAKPTTTKP
ncbi:MAG TPA: SGNH/GDSL hydrolase family protein [Magnetospirillaceae bacterium]